MKNMEKETYFELMEYLKKNAYALNQHERDVCTKEPEKRDIELHDIFVANLPITHCFEDEGHGYFICSTLRFADSISLYESEFKRCPNGFNATCSMDILKFLYKASNYESSGAGRTIDDYMQYLRTEACCYVICRGDSTQKFGKILRIDLFRKEDVDKKKDNRLEFTGGLFHVLKHFSMNGVNLSYNNDEILDVENICQIVRLLASAFVAPLANEKDDDYYSTIAYKGKELKVIFYLEKVSCVYFVKSMHIE